MRVAMYLRQSQDRTGQEFGIDRQRGEIHRLLEYRGWPAGREFIDNDVSATKAAPRPNFEAMLSAVHNGDYDVVVARHVDRLHRTLRDLVRLNDALEAGGAYLVTASDSIDTSTPGGEVAWQLLGVVASGESKRKIERQRAGHIQAAEQGRWIGGRRPFGYEKDGLTIRESEAELIRTACTAVLKGATVAAIARSWNDAGVPTPQPKRDGSPNSWVGLTVKKVLISARNAGYRAYKGETYPAAWPAIIAEDTWLAVTAILDVPERKRGGRATTSLLTGIATCGVCGATVNLGGKGRGGPEYRCSSGVCVTRGQRLADSVVEEWMIDYLTTHGPSLAASDASSDLPALLAKRDGLVVRQRQLEEEFTEGNGSLTAAQFGRMNAKLLASMTEVEAEIAAAGQIDTIGPLATATDVQAAWDDLELSAKRIVIARLARVVVNKGRGRASVSCTPR